MRNRRRVLVVDEDPAARGRAVTALGRQGYTVASAGSSAEATALLDRADFELVLVDLAQQRRDGGPVLDALRRLPARTAPFILTGSAADVSLADAVREGAFDYLTAPFDPPTLRAVAARALEHAVLARTTRELVEELDDANARLRVLNAELQARVDRATAELRRKVDELSQAKLELETAQRQRDQFIQTVAHDLGAPLSALEGYAALLGQDGVPRNVEARARDVIATEVRRLARLVGDLADAAPAGPGSFRIAPERCDLVEIAREQVDLGALQSRRHTFRLDAPDQPVAARCDRDRIAQVMANLLSNAVRHTPGGEVRVRLSSQDGQARLSVSDEGPGVPPELRRRLFDPWVRGQSPAGGHGAGLGLHIAKVIVEAHGGRIWIDEAGRGATFCVELPLEGLGAPQQPELTAAPVGAVAVGSGPGPSRKA